MREKSVKILAKFLGLFLIASRALRYSSLMNQARIASYRQLGATIGQGVIIRPGAMIKGCKNVQIGNNVFIGEMSSIVAYGGQILIGSETLIADNVYISARNHRFRKADQTIRAQGYKPGDVSIGEDVWLAHGAVVLAGSNIATGSVVAANLTAPKTTDKFEIILASGREKRT